MKRTIFTLALFLALAAPAAARDYVGLVNPWVESDRGRFFFFQSASNPFGFVKLRPDTSTNSVWNTGYHPSENEVQGFSHVHDWQLAGVQVMPTTGDVPRGDWKSHVDHSGEIAEPGYHRLHLDRYGITAELTATDRVGVHRYTYEKAGPSRVIVNLGGTLGEAEMLGSHVERVGNALEGYVDQRGTLTDGQYYGASNGQRNRLFFRIEFDQRVAGLDRDGEVYSVRFDHVRKLQMKVALSLTSTDGAARNLQAEAPGWSFDKIRRASQQRWNRMLGRIDVKGGTHQQQVKFYTDLFHVLCGRSTVSDADGRYLDNTWGARTVKRAKSPMFNYDALWLTQWSLNTVLGLAYPEVLSDFVNSQVRMYEDGGLLPRGPVAGDDSFVMTGSPVTSMIVGAYNKGIRDFDVDTAFDAMLDAQSLGGLFDKAPYEYATWGEAKGGAREYLTKGYIPFDLDSEWRSRGTGETLEFAFQDWTLAQLARQLHKRGINVAQFATATASSGDAARAIDGRPARSRGDVRWVPTDAKPWVRVAWDAPQPLTRIVVTDPGTLRFSDGTSVPVQAGTTSVRKRVDWVQFEGPGLGDIEVYDDRDVAAYLEQRSRNWRNLFDPVTGFIRPKGSDGKWLEPFDPLAETDFVESNAWQATWFTSQDVMGLANLMGGRKAYADKLDHAFELSAADDFIGGGQNGLENAYVSYANQPGLQAAHLFNYVGYPWLTQYWVRRVKQQTFGSTSTTDGYGHHDEDQGQMGALSALMAMGLFEVTGGGKARPVYDLTSPIFERIRIGRDLTITTHGDLKDPYIQAARLNGRPLDNAWLYHDQLRGSLDLWLGEHPNTRWGVDELPPSESEEAEAVHATGLRIDAPDVIREPYGTTALKARFQPANTSYQRADWTVTEPDGSPTAKATIDYDGVLTVNDEGGDVLVTATAADGHGATASKRLTIDLDPRLLRGNAARAPGVVATASSEFSADYAASRAIDGITGQWAVGEWASQGEQEPWIELRFPQPVRADRIVIYDRSISEDANGGTLTFGDGSSVDVTGIPPGGGPKTVTFEQRTFDRVRFQVKGGTGPNVGLSELEVYALPSVPEAPRDVKADGQTVSWAAPAYDGGAPLTGYVVTPYRDGTALDPIVVDEQHTSVDVQADRATVRARNLLGDGPEASS
jgi:putative alpha-1,2-mannosidase